MTMIHLFDVELVLFDLLADFDEVVGRSGGLGHLLVLAAAGIDVALLFGERNGIDAALAQVGRCVVAQAQDRPLAAARSARFGTLIARIKTR